MLETREIDSVVVVKIGRAAPVALGNADNLRRDRSFPRRRSRILLGKLGQDHRRRVVPVGGRRRRVHADVDLAARPAAPDRAHERGQPAVGPIHRRARATRAIVFMASCRAAYGSTPLPRFAADSTLEGTGFELENGFVYIPETAPWLAEYLHEMTVFPNGKHDDQVDSTAQFLDWFKRPMPNWGIFEYTRQLAEAAEQRCKPPPIKTNWALGSME